MQYPTRSGRLFLRAIPALTFPVLALALVLSPGFAWAKKEPKTYPIEGKVSATAISQVPYTYNTSDGKTTQSHRGIARTRTYTVQAGTKTYELDCGKRPGLFSTTPGECGGDKKIQLGDVIHFRVNKGWAYVSVTEEGQTDREQKMRILNEDLKSDTAPEDDAKQ